MKHEYYYLTEFGEFKYFDKKNPDLKKSTFLVLDSSVCLDIVNVVNKKANNKLSRRKAFEVLKYSKKKSMPPFIVFGLLELSLDKLTFRIDGEKFIDMSNKINFAFNFPLERLKKNDFDFSKNFYSPSNSNINENATPIMEQLFIHYSALLKIREIASKDLSKEKSKENIVYFIEWMNSELEMILGIEYQLAFQIFGGNTSFRSMIKENSGKEKTLKALWGTAWDLFHARVSRNSSQLSTIIGEDINSIFVTNDKKLFQLLAPQIEIMSKVGKTKIYMTDGNAENPPHFDDLFIEKLNDKVKCIFNKRDLSDVNYPNTEMIKTIISKLEENVN
ncbi:hypothetical protein UMM65_13885 [Aureibaculum sp. 2210JD6-5]|uniref:hypothetical protein n=1 Tax=Aureibaculum sp. 2210JD6-5 TaxID=3103957 RepID=UPI002AAD466F|nr:hypothetical protein [Aureibaculum sp. 2210JD6-5]MDY7396337.1 hypothetical protein [Aureibaculum sp. 2210JD6-5]